jgi:molecular chaperone GrpE
MTKENKKDWGKVRESMLDDETGLEDAFSEDTLDADDALSALNHPAYADLEQQLTAAEQKAHENWEKSVRAQAEVDNMRRRTDREVTNAHRYALEKFSTALLPVVDSLEHALELATKHGDDAMREGLELTMKVFVDTLEKNGVIQISPLGEVFNPQLHEAMTMQPVEGAQPNTISSVFQKGYLLNDRVIRPARVVVVKG